MTKDISKNLSTMAILVTGAIIISVTSAITTSYIISRNNSRHFAQQSKQQMQTNTKEQTEHAQQNVSINSNIKGKIHQDKPTITLPTCKHIQAQLLDVTETLPCGWYINKVINRVEDLSQQDVNDYIRPGARSKDWPIAKEFIIQLTNKTSTLTFDKIYYFFPGGVGGVTLKVRNPVVIYKPTNGNKPYLVRVKQSNNTYVYYMAQYLANGGYGPGIYHIGLGEGPVKATLTNPTQQTLKIVDNLMKDICITKHSKLCKIEP